MRLATVLTTSGETRAASIEGEHVRLLGWPDVGALLRAGGIGAVGDRSEKSVALRDVSFAPLVPRPVKILCVGSNYRSHVEEMGNPIPHYPNLWAKWPDSLVGPDEAIVLPRAAPEQCDFEAELCIVIGRRMRGARDEAEAAAAIAGYTASNDGSVRDWQFRSREALQGKAWERMTPVGPLLATPDEVDDARDLRVECLVNGERLQDGRTSDFIFRPAWLVAYISTFTTLSPGDLILTGTPSGVGFLRKPRRFLRSGDEVVTRIESIGELRNRCVAEEGAPEAPRW